MNNCPVLLAALTNSRFLNGVIWLVGLGLIFWLLWWLLDYVKLPEPVNKVARVLLVVLVVVFLIYCIMRVTGIDF